MRRGWRGKGGALFTFDAASKKASGIVIIHKHHSAPSVNMTAFLPVGKSHRYHKAEGFSM